MRYLPLVVLSLLALSGCASLTEKPQPNYAATNKINKWGIPAHYDPTDPHNLDNTNTPPRPRAHNAQDWGNKKYQQRQQQWRDNTGRHF